MLSAHSFNALLKTLEEPPPHVKFIFATTDPHKVLPTVVSRCQRYDLRRIATTELLAHLHRTVEAEKVTLSEDALALIAREAEGSLRDAQSLLEQVLTVAGSGAADDTVRAVLGAADRRLVVAVADGILARDAAACLRGLTQLYEHGYDARRFCRDLLEHFRNLAVLRATGDRTLVADLPEAEVAALVAQAERGPADDLQRAFGLLLDADEALAAPARTIEPQLVLEMAVLRLATLPPLLPIDEVLSRLDALDDGGARPARAPAARSVAHARPAGGAAGAPAGAAGFWDAFVARVREEKVSLYMILAAAKPLAVGDGVLRIGLENEAMRRELGRRDAVERLQLVASDLLGGPVRVEVGELPPEHSGDTPLAVARRRTEETLADPLVQAAVEIFGAEVRGVRERGS